MSKHGWRLSTIVLLSAVMMPLTAARVDRWERNNYRHSDVRAAAEDAERLSDSFREQLDRELDHTIVDGTKREKHVEKRARKLEKALDDVRSAVRDGRFDKARSSSARHELLP